MQGFCVRVAKGLNRLLNRKGPVFTERYHLRVLTTPVSEAKGWLLRVGWRRRGLVRVDEVPRAR